MTYRRCLCFALAALPLAAPAAPAPPTPLSTTPLSAALLRAVPPKTGVVLAVDADKLPLPPDAVLPGDTPTIRQVGAIYGRSVIEFGAVTGVVPPTITVVYAPPETPNPYDGMPPGQVMSLLAKTFTPAQWKAFLSPAGVAYTSMTGDTQAALFGALFPDGHLKVIQDNPIGENDPKTKKDISGDTLTTAHLRLGFLVSMALQMESEPTSYRFGSSLRPANSPPRYFMTNGQSNAVDHELGATVRETVPNTLRAGQIDYTDPALKAAVPLAGIKTVDDLVTRIGVTTKRELYADARYGTRHVTLLPANGSAPAADLLRALAVCVGGTYRQVGPAWVLTNDVIGLGTKHALWKAFEEKAAAMLPGSDPDPLMIPAPAAGPDVPYTTRDIPFGDEPLAFTLAQTNTYWKEWAKNPVNSSLGMMDITVPFDQLSSAQQSAAEMTQAANQKSQTRTTLDGKIMVQAEPEVEVILPALDGPVAIFQSYQSLLPSPKLTDAQEKAQAKQMAQYFPSIATPDAPPPPDMSVALRGFARRAARIAPETPEATVQAMQTLKSLGFTEAWLQIVPDPSVPDAAVRAHLAQAVAAGRTLGIAVLPDLTLLHWKNADKSSLDLSLQGQPAAPATVSPFAPAVAARLIALERTLAGVPGLAGLVWENSPPPGYETKGDDNVSNVGQTLLGYSEAGRLAFLRQAHADPVDLHDNSYTDERAHVSVAGFDSNFDLERRLFTGWGKRRADTYLALLGQLAATPAQAHLTLLMKPTNSSFSGSYGSWDDLHRPPPTVHYVSPEGPDGQPIMGAAMSEHLSSALTFNQLGVYLPSHPSEAVWKAAVARALMVAAKRGSRNVVLDMTDPNTLPQDVAKQPENKKP